MMKADDVVLAGTQVSIRHLFGQCAGGTDGKVHCEGEGNQKVSLSDAQKIQQFTQWQKKQRRLQNEQQRSQRRPDNTSSLNFGADAGNAVGQGCANCFSDVLSAAFSS